jgi:hypothetical protein
LAKVVKTISISVTRVPPWHPRFPRSAWQCSIADVSSSSRTRGRAVASSALALATLALVLVAGASGPRSAIVLVSRQGVPGDPGAIPGFGPHHRAVATGGRLLVLERDGRLRELVAAPALFDVADPAVSFDGRRVAFAGTPHPDSAWRIYVVGADGRGLTRVTRGRPELDLAGMGDSGGRFERYDDLDPCWIGEQSLCFASTRYPQRSEYADLPVTNLYRIDLDDTLASPLRLTSERNGAEEPCFDPYSGRVLFTRWWFNRQRPSRAEPIGFTIDPAAAAIPDSANLWQPMEIRRDGSDQRLAGGDPGARRGAMGYQPAVLRDGSRVAVYATNLGLSPRPLAAGIQRLGRGFGPSAHLAGAIVPESGGDPYSGALGLAAPSACAPAAAPDGGVLFAYDPGGRGDFGLYRMDRDGRGVSRVLDLPGTLELDPAALVARPLPRAARLGPLARLSDRPPVTLADLAARGRFLYHSLDVFSPPPRARMGDAPPPSRGARIRFYAALARPDREGGDTIVRVREAPVGPDGSVSEWLPADTPLFEQVVDSSGRVLLSAHGAAHVAGFNAGRDGAESRCIGCHLGHSTRIRAR